MTTQNETSNQSTETKPTHNLCVKAGYGKKTKFETIGVAWVRQDGGLYIKLHGTQIVDSGFYAFPVKDSYNEQEIAE